ncbi:unnamed protein product, partial [Rotaria sp. Silwood2]
MTTEKNKQEIETQKKKLEQKSIKKQKSNNLNQNISNSISSLEDNGKKNTDQTSKDISFNNTDLNTNQSLKHSIRPISEQIPIKQNNIENKEIKKIDRRKIARNRWYLAYTIIHNSYLFDLRKNLKEKCNRLYSQEHKSMNETSFPTTTVN